MVTGTVKWFDPVKGFGFIAQDNGGEDVFCHYSKIDMSGYKNIEEGQKVSFLITQGEKGLQALEVKLI